MELLDVHYLEWVSVPLNRGGEEPRGGATLSLFLGWWAWGLPLLTPAGRGQLGPLLSRLLFLTTKLASFFIQKLEFPKYPVEAKSEF